MRVVRSENELANKLGEAQRESLTAFGSDECFIEKFVEKYFKTLGGTHASKNNFFEDYGICEGLSFLCSGKLIPRGLARN